jgi:CheY-like chemotaxis protein
MDIVDIIHSSLMYSLKRKPLKETMSFILNKIISLTGDDYGFIGEVLTNESINENSVDSIKESSKIRGADIEISDDNKLIRYHTVFGFTENHLESLTTFGYLDHNHMDSLHGQSIRTKEPFISNNMERTKFPCPHRKISKFITIPFLNEGKVIGLLGLGKKSSNSPDYDQKTVTFLKPVSIVIGSTFLHIKDLINLSNQKDIFLANISHEIRTPLNGIVCLAKLLSKTKCSTEQQKYVTIINQCSIQLLEIVNDILDYSKINNNKMPLHHKPFAIKDVISSAFNVVRFKAVEKELYLNYIIEDSVPETIIIDNTRLCQVIVNLVSNSIKFTKKGHIILRISLDSCVGNMCCLKFVIEDTGIGISKDQISRIFDTFRQIPNNYIANSVGVGLGLPISKHIIEMFNGKIWVESKIDIGTKMHFTINIKKYTKIVDTKQLKKFYTGKNVLIIDNDSASRKILFATLIEINIKPIICDNMADANMYLSNDIFEFEFIIINIAYVNIVDIERLNRIKNNSVKIILLDQHIESKIKSMNYDYKLYKPLEKSKLESVFNLIFVERQSNNSPDNRKLGTINSCKKIDGLIHQSSISDRKEDFNSPIKSIIKKIKVNPPKKFRILVAEDIKTNQIVIVTLLKSLGYHDIKVVSNGKLLIEELESCKYNYSIVFVDLKMPEIDGLTASKHIIKTLPKSKYGQLIAVTASISSILEKDCYSIGMTSYITKPIEIEELECILNSAHI